MGKIIKEDCKFISIHKLKEWGILKHNYYGGSIIWTSGYSGEKSDVKYIIDLQDGYFRLQYKIKTGGEEWKSIDHKYPLTPSSCTYGGQRWWFICSVYSSGRYCGKRVANLYLGSGSHYFACRHCYNLTYQSRNENRGGKMRYLFRILDVETKIELIREKMKRSFYAGKPTRKMRRVMRLNRGIMPDVDILMKNEKKGIL